MSASLEAAKPRASREAPKAIVRPVSQVSLVLSDQRAFETAIRESVIWMNSAKRCAGAIPRDALGGNPFDLTHSVGALPAAATAYEDGRRRIWSGKLDFPDREVGQRTWSTEISIVELGPVTTFVSRLTNITRGDNPPYLPSVPGVVQQVVGQLSAEADGFPISDEVPRVDLRTLPDFEYLLHNKQRRLPIVALSETDEGRCLFEPGLALRRLIGAAHVVRLDPAVSWQLTRSLGREYSVFGGAGRIYWPGFDADHDDPFRHPLQRISQHFDVDDYLAWLSSRVLPRAFIGLDADKALMRFTDVQALVSRQQREAMEVRSGPADREHLDELVENLKSSLAASEEQRREDADAAQALLDEASETTQIVEQERDELIAENARLRSKLLALTALRPAQTDDRTPRLESYDDLEVWSTTTLGDHIEVLPRALREGSKHGAPETLERIEKTLLLIRDYYVPMRLEQKDGAWDAFRKRCEEIGVEESACFSNKGDIKNFPGYRASFAGRRVYLERHFKFGTGYDLRRMFRIYFTWDEDTKSVIIGHMPTHLDNNNTQ